MVIKTIEYRTSGMRRSSSATAIEFYADAAETKNKASVEGLEDEVLGAKPRPRLPSRY